MLPTPPLSLDQPGTFVFDVGQAMRGQALNRFAASLRDPARRAAFAADEQGVMTASSVPGDVIAMVGQRDWTGLMRAGGHLQLLLLIAHSIGYTLWDLGAHNVGCDPAELIEACPRRVSGLPAGWGTAWRS